ncbi:calcium-binding protein [Falsiroseomonas sp. CW058]|uniref:calcium-binding protein n=1 Tax=Falsiroseomonas sp. CW058 TaxID=3388664 RepID=UPI003D3157F2
MSTRALTSGGRPYAFGGPPNRAGEPGRGLEREDLSRHPDPPFALLKPEPGDAPMSVLATATGTATGENTLAAGHVSATVIDRGAVTLAFGTATATATASDPASAFATAATGVEVAGADLALSRTTQASGSGTFAGQAWWTEQSTTVFLAVDIDGWQPSAGPIAIHHLENEAPVRVAPPGGNLASFTTDIAAFGENTLVDVQVEAIAVEDRLSSVSILAAAQANGSPSAVPDEVRMGGVRSDRMLFGAGDDWAFGGFGNDTILAGQGDNTAFGNAGNDSLQGLAGDDWLFGGDGNDVLLLGDGRNIGDGGDGNDRITGGGGADAIRAGRGNDTVEGGGGDDTFLLGDGNRAGDGNDLFTGGGGADWYVLAGAFGRDTVRDFRLAEGDRLVVGDGDWEGAAALAARNGQDVTLQRAGRDLVVTMLDGQPASRLTLTDFFVLNPAFAATRAGLLNDAAALPLLQQVFHGSDGDAAYAERTMTFGVADMLSLIA